MALDSFKNIVDRKGYLVEQEDRKIFEKEIGKSNFGLGYSDMFEFILYDSNDNQLPQGEDGKMVRYVDISDSKINEYFLISDNKSTKKMNGASEFIVDIEKLIREAGYSSGIFKTQVTLLNRRVGSEGENNDKVWIHEISPSRTEIRLLPVKGKPNADLLKRYDIFVNDGNFRDDTIYYAIPFIENLNFEKVLSRLLLSKGNERKGRNYFNLIKSEFKLDSVELMVNRIKDKYIESMQNFIKGKEWNINSYRYGRQLPKVEVIELSKSIIEITALQALTNSIEKYLPKRNIREKTGLTKEEQVTIDEVKQILKTASSNTAFQSDIPSTIDSVVRGCMDTNALNYNPNAKEDDGSCQYKSKEIDAIVEELPDPVKGCTDTQATNYNPNAEEDDGSCQYKDSPVYQSENYYIWSKVGKIRYKDLNGEVQSINGKEYDFYKIKYQYDTLELKGDIRTVPKVKIPPFTKPKLLSFIIKNESTRNITPRVSKKRFFGRTSPRPIFKGQDITVRYKDKTGKFKSSSVIKPGSSITICAEDGSVSQVPGAKITRAGACTVATYNPPPRPIPKPKPIPSPIIVPPIPEVVPEPKPIVKPRATPRLGRPIFNEGFRDGFRNLSPRPEPRPEPRSVPSITRPVTRSGGGSSGGGGGRRPLELFDGDSVSIDGRFGGRRNELDTFQEDNFDRGRFY